jgi:tRNA modification GTPase
MFSPDDTIVAIATPAGRGGIGVVRISGRAAHDVALQLLSRQAPLEPRYATFTHLSAPSATADDKATEGDAAKESVTDEVVVTFFPAPHSYTGEHVVEISAHGSPVVLESIVRRAVAGGARLAQPGEFTLRAFLSGKRDLVQAEAVADLIEAATPLQARVAFDQLDGTLTRRIAAIDAELFDLIARLEASLDFPDEGYHFIEPAEIASRSRLVIEQLTALIAEGSRGRMIREGATVVILGRPNVGKSSLFNMLAGSDRSIVTNIPGTTRDLITERIDIGGISTTMVDTAGARSTLDVIEREGVERGARAQSVADLLLVVLDGSAPLTDDDRRLVERTSGTRRLMVVNKADLPMRIDGDELTDAILISVTAAQGIDALRTAIVRALTGEESLRERAAISNARHLALLESARSHLTTASAAAAGGDTPEEFVLVDLQAARARFDEIVGTRTSEDVLRHIFERFCIGK